MGELISRQAAIEALYQWMKKPSNNEEWQELLGVIHGLPSVQPERKNGEWIEHKWAEEVSDILISNYECSKCHCWKRETSDFCPNCGSDMRGGQNG